MYIGDIRRILEGLGLSKRLKYANETAGYAHKECDLDGVWFKHPLTNKTWSNYTTCVNYDDFEVSGKLLS